jgi:hypothetical protein
LDNPEERLDSSNPAHCGTGSLGYFGYSGSRNDRKHMMNTLARSLRISFLWMQCAQSPGSVTAF